MWLCGWKYKERYTCASLTLPRHLPGHDMMKSVTIKLEIEEEKCGFVDGSTKRGIPVLQ